MYESTAYHAMSTDIEILVDHDHGCSVIEGRNGGSEAGHSGPNGDEVRRMVLLRFALCIHVCRHHPAQSGCTNADGRTLL